jgi:hypothetical protein
MRRAGLTDDDDQSVIEENLGLDCRTTQSAVHATAPNTEG